MRTRSLVPARRAPSVSGSLVSVSSSMGASSTSMPSSASTRTTPSSASAVSSARSIAVVTSPIVTKPRERPSATRSVSCCESDGPLVTTVRLTKTSVRHAPPVSGDLILSTRPAAYHGGNLRGTCRQRPSAAGCPVEQPLPALLERHQFAEHPVVRRLLLHRIRALQPRLDGGDLASGGQFADPGEHDAGVLLVRLGHPT